MGAGTVVPVLADLRGRWDSNEEGRVRGEAEQQHAEGGQRALRGCRPGDSDDDGEVWSGSLSSLGREGVDGLSEVGL